ncbi:hypothetical protein L332_10325 [Agrococcus pavilionensis RW1]|uniref:Helix-turn-helix domain-containing protein n=1 Tax=Agrococcus pavilionensis RW1 TaxID=1330458 RepID=U1LRX7_9MICO|nr:helix-turn-helix domain-containing protein [Agrococcus pavilionensis]ERG64837.1 hypothetical protein L332_10325 [Agrococcus pavilionensis RW1]
MDTTMTGITSTATTTRWCTVKEIATHLNIHRTSVYKWVRERNMPVSGFSGSLRFDVNAVDAWLRTNGAA